MATITNKYGFKKPEQNDFYSVEDQNRNWDLAEGAISKLNTDLDMTRFEFTGYPRDFLPNAESGFAHCKVLLADKNANFSYAPPTKYPNGAAWWNVLTFGVSSRCTQIACFSFSEPTGGGLIYMRYQHDERVSDWIKVV